MSCNTFAVSQIVCFW